MLIRMLIFVHFHFLQLVAPQAVIEDLLLPPPVLPALLLQGLQATEGHGELHAVVMVDTVQEDWLQHMLDD